MHLCSPGPAGVAAALTARIMELPVAGSYHTELAAYTALRTGDERLALGRGSRSARSTAAARGALALARSPTRGSRRWASRPSGSGAGTAASTSRASRRHGATRAAAAAINVLYAGRLTREKGADLLADAFLAARARDPRLHLLLAGGGPEEDACARRLGDDATFLGWLEGDALARAYASADLFLFCSRTDTFGQVILEAQASGLPVVAVAEGGPTELIADGRSGVLCPPERRRWPSAVCGLAASRRPATALAAGRLADGPGRRRALAAGRARGGGRRALGAR